MPIRQVSVQKVGIDGFDIFYREAGPQSRTSDPTNGPSVRVTSWREAIAMEKRADLVPTSEWDYCAINELAKALHTRKISASELVEHAIARIEAFDQRLNAVVVRDFDRARKAATAADVDLARGERRSLLGIPITFKEAFNIGGMPTTWGFSQFKDFVPKQDALIVSRAKSAGAIILGKTNVSLGLEDLQSYNDVYGTTNNPWDTSRTPGGSSGGCAAALAAGFVPLSFGSDIGGSLRQPAHCCGIYSHKPTLGLIPLRGYNPPPFPPLPGHGDLAVAGPMARTAADLVLAFDIAAGPDEEHEGIGYRLTLPPARHEDLKSFRVLVIDVHPLMPTDSTVRMAMARLADRLAKSGVKVARASALLPNLADSARLYMRLVASILGAHLPPHRYEEKHYSAAALAPDDNSLGAERTRGAVMSHRDWIATDAARKRLQQQWSLLFREWDVVLYPPAAVPAFPHDHSLPIEARQLEIDGKSYPYYDACLVWADPATTCGLPVTTAPIGRSPSGLPIGVQIIGPYLEDRTTLAFAKHLEREFGGFVPPPSYAGS
jgi:amidase